MLTISGCGNADQARIDAAAAKTEQARSEATRTFPAWPERCLRPMPYVTPHVGESKRSIVGRNDLNVAGENRTKLFCSQFYSDATAPLSSKGARP